MTSLANAFERPDTLGNDDKQAGNPNGIKACLERPHIFPIKIQAIRLLKQYRKYFAFVCQRKMQEYIRNEVEGGLNGGGIADLSSSVCFPLW